MSHSGYIAYVTMVIALYASPLIAYALYRGWKRGRLLRTLVLTGIALPAVGTTVYVITRYAG